MVKKVKKVSPFEVHVNRDKSKVLGRQTKADRGLPGVSRSKAIAKRKNTLLIEYKNRDRNNLFLDKRIGERNQNLTPEDRALARFTAEKLKSYGKRNMANLNEDEILTHNGQSLMDIEKYDNLRISDDDDSEDGEEKSGMLDKKFVADAHFGGGMLSKATSRKDIIQQIIINDKIRKAEKQKEKEEKINLTEKIDAEWHDLLPLVNFGKKDDSNKKEVAETKENSTKTQGKGDYDMTMRALKFEARLPATDKLKPTEEIEREEKAQLEKHEKERLERMHGFTDADTEYLKQHKSADDLDDFKIEKIVDEPSDDEDEKLVSFADLIQKMRKKKEKEEKQDDENSSEEENEESDAEDGDNNDDDDEDEDEDGDDDIEEHVGANSEEHKDKDEQESAAEDSEIEEEEEDEDEEGNSDKNVHSKERKEHEMSNNENDDNDSSAQEESESEDNLSDLKEETSEEESEEEEETPKKSVKKKEESKKPISQKSDCLIQKDIESIISDHYKSFEKNKKSMLDLFSILLEHLENQYAFGNDPTKERFFKTFDRLCPHMYDLAHANPSETRNIILTCIRKKHDEFENNSKVYPGLNTLILFKLVSLLYPTSDFRHQVVTPTIVFMSQILLKCRVKTKQDIAKGLFIVALILEYTALSGRWDPAAINYLRGILFVSLPKPLAKRLTVVPPFKNTSQLSNILVLEKNQSKNKLSADRQQKTELSAEDIKMKAKDFSDTEMDDDFRIRAFCTSINLLHSLEAQLNKFDTGYSIFEPHLTILKSCSVKWYPNIVRDNVKSLIAKIEQLKEKKIEHLTFEKKKPKPLKQLEPVIEVVTDTKRRMLGLSKEKQEEKKLIHKLKREKRGVVRELRRDTAYTTKIRIKEEIASNLESKRKYNKFKADLAEEAHEAKKFKKT